MAVKTVANNIGTGAVEWVWRKKLFASRLDAAKRRMKSPGWYQLADNGDGTVWLAWRCPIEVGSDGREYFPNGSQPCSESEIKTLDYLHEQISGIKP